MVPRRLDVRDEGNDMKWNRLTETAKRALDSRGGADGLKRDAEQLRDIARGQGSPKDKARRAAEALKQREGEKEHDAGGQHSASGRGSEGIKSDSAPETTKDS
jgi:hypothetical protein